MSNTISFALQQNGKPSAMVSLAMPLGAYFRLFSFSGRQSPLVLSFSLPSSLPTRRLQCNSITYVVPLPSREV